MFFKQFWGDSCTPMLLLYIRPWRGQSSPETHPRPPSFASLASFLRTTTKSYIEGVFVLLVYHEMQWRMSHEHEVNNAARTSRLARDETEDTINPTLCPYLIFYLIYFFRY